MATRRFYLLGLWVLLIGLLLIGVVLVNGNSQFSPALAQPAPQPTLTLTPAVYLPLIQKPAATPTNTPTNTPTPTPTPTPTHTPTSTPTTTVTIAPTHFIIGLGGADNLPRQIIRTNDDRLYVFSTQQYSNTIRVYWTTSAGLPITGTDFAGKLVVTESGNPISIDAVYDGGNMIHVLVNSQDGKLRDHPFNITTNVFTTAIVLATNTQTVVNVDNYYVGSCGVSGMFDTNGVLHVAYWVNTDHINHAGYTYNSSTNALTTVITTTQVDTATVKANHPQLAVSPMDNSVTIAWVSENATPKIAARTRSNAGTWGSVETASTDTVWTSTSFGINVDQGPSLIISADGTKHLVYIENFDPADYGHLHYTRNAGAG